MRISRGLFTRIALAAMLALAPALAEAKMGGSFGGGAGSRGSRTFAAPPATRTAPAPAAPIERSVTPQGAPSAPLGAPSYNPGAQRPVGAPGGAMGSSFGRGLLGGLAGGLLGAGLFGMLTGQGFFGGMGGFMSIIGLLIQIALIVFLARMAFIWWTNRNAMAGAGAGAGPNRGRSGFPGGGFNFMGGPGGAGAAAAPPRAVPLRLANEDFPAFERLLGESQAAYSREDAAGLRRLATPEMVSYFEEELAANRAKGVVNRISGVKLLQGDLSEAWREGADEYATVAMRFALTDVMEDRASGRPLSSEQAEATELWTFRRPAGAGPDAWKLSAIQHTR